MRVRRGVYRGNPTPEPSGFALTVLGTGLPVIRRGRRGGVDGASKELIRKNRITSSALPLHCLGEEVVPRLGLEPRTN